MRLYLLGQPHLEIGEKVMPLSKNHSQILTWLVMHQKTGVPLPRVRLARAIWTDCTDEQGRKRLANSLYRLRQELPEIEEYLLGDPNSLSLEPIWTDAQEFKHLINSPTPQDWINALELYKGDLLEGEDIPWLDTWRSELHQTMLSGLRQATQATHSSQAIQLTQRLIQLEPWNEEAHTHLIRLYANENRLLEAISTYEKLETILTQEFSSQVKPETQAFIKDLKRQLEQNDQAPSALVGRKLEWRSLTNALNAVRVGQGGIILIEGEPGQGKTRLLLELKSLAVWHSLSVLYGAAANSTPAYTPLEQALRGVLGLLEQTTPLIQKNLEPLLKTGADSESQANPQVVTAALERWLRHLEQPTIWLLDDLQWAGDLFWTILKMLARISQQRPVLIVVSARSQELRENQKAFDALLEIRQNQQALHFNLDGLSLEECTILARGYGKKISNQELEQMHRISAGNPLVFQELALGNKADKHLEDAFQSRFAKLDKTAREALEAASVLGKHLDLATWEAMLGASPPIAQLLENRFLHSEPALGFQHDLTRVFVYEQMKPEIRQKWHGQAFEVLKTQEARADVLAHHAEEAGLLAESVPYYRKAAEVALNFAAYKDVETFIKKGIDNNHGANPRNFEGLFLSYLHLLLINYTQGNVPLDKIEALETAAREGNFPEIVFKVILFKLRILATNQDKEMLLQAAESLLAFTQEIENKVFETVALTTISVSMARAFNEPVKSLGYATKAYELSQKLGAELSIQQRFKALSALINACIRAEDFDLAWKIITEAEVLFSSSSDLIGYEVQILNVKGALALLEEHFELALNIFQKQLEICYIRGESNSIVTSLQNLIETLKILGRFEEAFIWAEELAERAPKAIPQLTESQTTYYFTYLAEINLLLGNFEAAELPLRPIQTWLEQGITSAFAIDARKVVALIEHAKENFSKALELIKHNLTSSNHLPETLLLAAEFAHLAGHVDESKQYLQQAFSETQSLEKNYRSTCLHYVAYLIYQKPTDLEVARFSLLRFATQIETLENRQIMLNNVYYAKAIETAWQQQNLETTIVELPALIGEGTIEVIWTLSSGASDKAYLEQGGKVALRNHRLKRLMLEAQAQGAKALQRQLATALGVTVRTIEADFAQLKLG
jgi:DNA-binding SARP family transcriptional activator